MNTAIHTGSIRKTTTIGKGLAVSLHSYVLSAVASCIVLLTVNVASLWSISDTLSIRKTHINSAFRPRLSTLFCRLTCLGPATKVLLKAFPRSHPLPAKTYRPESPLLCLCPQGNRRNCSQIRCGSEVNELINAMSYHLSRWVTLAGIKDLHRRNAAIFSIV